MKAFGPNQETWSEFVEALVRQRVAKAPLWLQTAGAFALSAVHHSQSASRGSIAAISGIRKRDNVDPPSALNEHAVAFRITHRIVNV